MKLFLQKKCKIFERWGLRPHAPVLSAAGLRPNTPLASGGRGLSPQTPQTATPIANFWLRAWYNTLNSLISNCCQNFMKLDQTVFELQYKQKSEISHSLVVKWPSKNKGTRDASVGSSNQRWQYGTVRSEFAYYVPHILNRTVPTYHTSVQVLKRSVPAYRNRTSRKKMYRTSIPYFLAKIEAYRTVPTYRTALPSLLFSRGGVEDTRLEA